MNAVARCHVSAAHLETSRKHELAPTSPTETQTTSEAVEASTSKSVSPAAAATGHSSSAPSNNPHASPDPSQTRTRASKLQHASTSASKNKKQPKESQLSKEEIDARIKANWARKAARIKFCCPACNIPIVAAANVPKHVQRCCPDLCRDDEWARIFASDDEPEPHQLLPLMQKAEQEESKLRDQALYWMFRWGSCCCVAGGVIQQHSICGVQVRLVKAVNVHTTRTSIHVSCNYVG